MSDDSLRRLSEVARIGICVVWGLTFVMVQDAIELLPTMATEWLRAGLIMAAIVAVEVMPRFRPPRPLPEG